MKQNFYFNTGVKPWNSSYMEEGDKWINNERHILFICEDVPDGSTFLYGAQTDDLENDPTVKAFAIVGGNLLSKYAYFKLQKS